MIKNLCILAISVTLFWEIKTKSSAFALFCFRVFAQRHARAQRVSFAVTICAAFPTVGSVTMTTTVRTTRMKGTVVSGGSLFWLGLWTVRGRWRSCTKQRSNETSKSEAQTDETTNSWLLKTRLLSLRNKRVYCTLKTGHVAAVEPEIILGR